MNKIFLDLRSSGSSAASSESDDEASVQGNGPPGAPDPLLGVSAPPDPLLGTSRTGSGKKDSSRGRGRSPMGESTSEARHRRRIMEFLARHEKGGSPGTRTSSTGSTGSSPDFAGKPRRRGRFGRYVPSFVLQCNGWIGFLSFRWLT